MFQRQGRKKNVFDKGNPAKMYSLMECLGEGTYGTVWTGEKNDTGVKCAVKIVTIDDDLEEIEQEIAIMKDSNSPYIVKFFGAYWGDREKIWMVMEHCVAGSINDLMYVCDITLSMEQVRTTSAAIALGLRYLHKHYIIHRDIKAGNVLLTDGGHIRLADFGVSAKLRKASDRTTTAIGAPFWMAPEVIQEEPYDGRADVWSLGITVIELMEGRPPNSHMNAMKALFIIPQQQPPKLQDKKLPADIHDFVKDCLTKHMKKRPNSKMMLQHKFIKAEARKIEENNGSSEIMRRLVVNSLNKIEKWRKEDDDGESEPSIEEPVQQTLKHTTIKKSVSIIEEASVEDKGESVQYPPRMNMGHVSMISERTHINAARDGNLRKSAKFDPVRDTYAPSENKFGKNQLNNMSDEAVLGMLDDDNEISGGVMPKQFISLLKSIFKTDPSLFRNKAPKDWTGEDIAVAMVKTMIDISGGGGTAGLQKISQMNSNYKSKDDLNQAMEEFALPAEDNLIEPGELIDNLAMPSDSEGEDELGFKI